MGEGAPYTEDFPCSAPCWLVWAVPDTAHNFANTVHSKSVDVFAQEELPCFDFKQCLLLPDPSGSLEKNVK